MDYRWQGRTGKGDPPCPPKSLDCGRTIFLHIYYHTVKGFKEGCRKMKKEKERIICAIPEEETYRNTVNTESKKSAVQEKGDLQAELSEKAAAQPEVEDCSNDNIPDGTAARTIPTGSGKKKESTIESTSGRLLVPDVTSMTKYLCSSHRLIIYSYLNQCLKDGSLAKTAKLDIRDTWLNRRSCELTEFSYWKIDRTSFYTDVLVTLHLKTGRGTVTWRGTVAVWCSFEEEEEGEEDKGSWFIEKSDADDGFIYVIEELVPEVPDRSGYVRLSPFLVPYYRNAKVDELAEHIWTTFLPEALYDPEMRDAPALAKKMGMSIRYLPVHRHKKINSILFFKTDTIEILEEGSRPGTVPQTIRIPANTIVINTNAIRQDYSSYDIFHECIHYEEHYLFYCLQKLSSNDVTKVPSVETDPEEGAGKETAVSDDPEAWEERNDLRSNTDQVQGGQAVGVPASRDAKKTDSSAGCCQRKDKNSQKKTLKDPIYFMEKQANRGASALMMPASDTRSRILEESIKAEETIRRTLGRPSRHLGEIYEEVGKQLSKKLGVPHFRIRARLIQLGYVEAKGSLNYVEKKLIQPFAFEPESWQESTHTFNIDRRTLQNLMIGNEDLRKVMESKRYVYADGHVVRNGCRFLEMKKDWMGLDNLVLSDWANRHVDECCLRFVRVYMQEGIGQYVFGRMYYDAEFVARTRFYIDDFLNREKIGDIDDIEARMLYKQRFPKKFAEAFQFLRVANGTKMTEMADALGLTEQQLRRWLDMPAKYRNEDFLTAVALVLELPDWISRLLFKRAGLVLDDENPRHVALDHILRVQSCDGIPAANSYLERHSMSALAY